MELEPQNLATTGMNPILTEMHKIMTNLVLEFRDSVCKELDISVPTYYRKMREESGKGQSVLPKIDQRKTEIIISTAFMELVKAANYIKGKYMAERQQR